MQIHLSPRHLQLTASIHQAVANAMSHLEEYGAEILAAHVVMIAGSPGLGGERYTVKVHLAVPGPDIHAEDSEKDLYVALDLVVKKLARQLRKRKTALSDKRRKTSQRAVEQQREVGSLPRAIRKSLTLNGGKTASSR